jgi:ADP-ribose pyrophosphatase YjhB (NUDIX family)
MTVVFVGIILSGSARHEDDSAEIEWVNLDQIQNKKLAFDHEQIISDYAEWRISGGTFWSFKRRQG